MTKKKLIFCCLLLFFAATFLSTAEAQNFRRPLSSLSPNPSISGETIKFNVRGNPSDMFVLNIRDATDKAGEILYSHTVFGGVNTLPSLKKGNYYFVLIKVGDPIGTIAGRGIITVRSSDFFQDHPKPN